MASRLSWPCRPSGADGRGGSPPTFDHHREGPREAVACQGGERRPGSRPTQDVRMRSESSVSRDHSPGPASPPQAVGVPGPLARPPGRYQAREHLRSEPVRRSPEGGPEIFEYACLVENSRRTLPRSAEDTRVPPSTLPSGNEADAVLVSQDVLSRLKGDILDGHYMPGARLRFADLQRSYRASIGTLREALSQLLPEGLVELDANRGFRVAPISADDLRDVSSLHVEFEQRALVESVKHGGDAWEAGVVLAFHRLAKIEALPREERKQRSSEWLTAHRHFHAALVAACPSRWLLRLRAQLYDHMERYRLISQRHRPIGPSKRAEHEAIKDAALARKADRAGDLLAAHLRETTETVLRCAPQFMPKPP
ncbi:MAG: FCD domain-containing protein [Rhodospirillaceae bacterium]